MSNHRHRREEYRGFLLHQDHSHGRTVWYVHTSTGKPGHYWGHGTFVGRGALDAAKKWIDSLHDEGIADAVRDRQHPEYHWFGGRGQWVQ